MPEVSSSICQRVRPLVRLQLKKNIKDVGGHEGLVTYFPNSATSHD